MIVDVAASDRPDGIRVAIVAARFNGVVVDKLVAGADEALDKYGVNADQRTLVYVPGCFELPLAAQLVAPANDAVVCLGAVIRGETAHFDFVAGEAAAGIRDVSLRLGTPVVFGVLTTDTLEQALDRAGGAHGNKGWDAVEAALEMAAVVRTVEKP